MYMVDQRTVPTLTYRSSIALFDPWLVLHFPGTNSSACRSILGCLFIFSMLVMFYRSLLSCCKYESPASTGGGTVSDLRRMLYSY